MAEPNGGGEILLTGATGFVGQALYPVLEAQGYQVRCASRNARKASDMWPRRKWVHMDIDDAQSVADALRGCRGAYYLIHRMADNADYEEQEAGSAMNFLDAATRAGVERIVYLGGLKPAGDPGPHLRSRLVTGAILRSGEPSTVELRASMIVGEGSASWKIVRDIAMRLPVMVVPKWLRNRTEPVAIDDVTTALTAAIDLDVDGSAWFAIPGPEVLQFKECIERVCELVQNRPMMIDIPLLTPRLSSYWLRLVSGANYHVAKELALGLKDDLIAESDEYWTLIDHHDRLSFGDAARKALMAEEDHMNRYERLIHTVVREGRS